MLFGAGFSAQLSAYKSAAKEVAHVETGPSERDRVAADPKDNDAPRHVSAKVIEGPDGLWLGDLVTAQALDRVESPALLFP